MPPVYITGFDDRPSAQAAVEYARHLAAVTGAHVVAAHVFSTPGYPYASPYVAGGVPVIPEDLSEHARETAERLLATLPGAVERLAIHGTSVPHELHELARDRGAALLVVGATHRGAVGRLLPGSIGERLLHGATCPVLVVPEYDGSRPIRRIGVAFDGRAESRRALDLAERLAERFGVGLELLSILDPGVAALHAHDRGAFLEAVAREVAARGIEVEVRMIVDPAAGHIVSQCEDIDLLVIGSRGYGPLRSILLGGTSRHIVDHAPCPVLVLPRGADTDLLAPPPPAATEAPSRT